MEYHSDIIKSYLDAGLTVFPCEGVFRDGEDFRKKPKPMNWANSKCKLDEFTTGWIGMACVNGIEVVDIDNKLFNARHICAGIWKGCRFRSKFTVQTTVSGGFHLIYRVEEPMPNRKLAYQKDVLTGSRYAVCETRGIGGQIIVAPTNGYKVVQGDLTRINTITVEERDWLFDICAAFGDRTERIVTPDLTPNSASFSSRFNAMGGALNIAIDHLVQNGWKMSGRYEISRPEHNKKSASILYNNNCIKVWSSNAYPFEEGKAYTPFTIISLIKFDGDYRKTATYLGDLYRDKIY